MSDTFYTSIHESIDTLQMELEEAQDIIVSLHDTIETLSPGWHEREYTMIRSLPSMHKRIHNALLLHRVGEETDF